MSNLDCNSPRGREYIIEQNAVAKRFAAKYGMGMTMTSGEKHGDIDALFHRDGELKVIAEIKVREMTLAQLKIYGTYLITFDKLVRGADMSRRLACQFILIVYLKPDDKMFYWRISNDAGLITLRGLEVRPTVTKESCNGGSIIRSNAYIPVTFGNVVDESTPTAPPV